MAIRCTGFPLSDFKSGLELPPDFTTMTDAERAADNLINGLSRDLTEAQKEIDDQETEIHRLEEENRKQGQELDDLKDDQIAKQETIDTLEAENKALEDRIDTLERQISDLNEKLLPED